MLAFQVQCIVKALSLSDLQRTLKKGEIVVFTEEEFLNSKTLVKAEKEGWIEILKHVHLNEAEAKPISENPPKKETISEVSFEKKQGKSKKKKRKQSKES